MAATTVPRDAQRKEGDIVSYRLPASTSVTIYRGAMVNVYVADGYAYPGRNGTATDKFVGVAAETVSGNGTAGSARVDVLKSGSFIFAATGMAQTDVGKAVYVLDDQTVTLTSTSAQLCGYIEEFLSATSVRVRINIAAL